MSGNGAITPGRAFQGKVMSLMKGGGAHLVEIGEPLEEVNRSDGRVLICLPKLYAPHPKPSTQNPALKWDGAGLVGSGAPP